MKKIILTIFAGATVFSLSACSKDNNANQKTEFINDKSEKKSASQQLEELLKQADNCISYFKNAQERIDLMTDSEYNQTYDIIEQMDKQRTAEYYDIEHRISELSQEEQEKLAKKTEEYLIEYNKVIKFFPEKRTKDK
ncbi:MAG: hypothetical protein ACRCR5_01580 [Lactococcus garvieae]